MSAIEMATDLGDRIIHEMKHESERLRSLELPSLPLRQEQPKHRSKVGTFTVVALCVGVAYALYRMVRGSSAETSSATSRPSETWPRTEQAKETVRSA